MKLRIEIADTPELLTKGLMGRQSLAENEGMLFKFPFATESAFWGKNTYIPLDIAFINNEKIVDIKQIVPMSTRFITSNQSYQMALETNANFFSKNNINVGHRIQIQNDEIEFFDV